MEYAGISRRALSFILDLVILWAIMLVVGVAVLAPVGMLVEVALEMTWDSHGFMVTVILVGITVVSYVYFVWGFTNGATVGQRLFRLAVVGERLRS